MYDAKVDDLGGVVFHHENVAGLEIAMNEAALVGRLQSAAGLHQDLYRPIHREPLAGALDEVIESVAGKERHNEIWLAPAVLLELADVEDVNDVGMAEAGQHGPLFREQLDGGGVGDVAHGLERHIALGHVIPGAIDDAHPPLAERGADLVPVIDPNIGRHNGFESLQYTRFLLSTPGRGK